MTAPNPAWVEDLAKAMFAIASEACPIKGFPWEHQDERDRAVWRDCAAAAHALLTPLIARETAERCAEIAENLGWILPVLDSHILNEATDDAACSVTKQAAAAIRAAFQPFDISSIAYIPEGQISGQSRKESGSESVSDGLSGPQPVTTHKAR